MKYKVTANGIAMVEGVSALKALNIVCGILQSHFNNEFLKVEVSYLSKSGWKQENSFQIGEPEE